MLAQRTHTIVPKEAQARIRIWNEQEGIPFSRTPKLTMAKNTFTSSTFQRISAACGVASGRMKNPAMSALLSFDLTVPPITEKHRLIAELDADRALVEADRELAARFEQKLQSRLAEIWGEASEVTTGGVDRKVPVPTCG